MTTDPPTYLASAKRRIDDAFGPFFDDAERRLRGTARLAHDVLRRLRDFTVRGKTIRGSLCLACAELGDTDHPDAALPIAMAVELVHSGLLIHDDIMDNDLLRRGHPSLFGQYLAEARKAKAQDSRHLGLSLAICAGDIAYFLAASLLRDLPLPPPRHRRLLALFNEEIVKVGLGQMDDVWWSAVPQEPSEEDIERIYRFKTSRYTFSLPCLLGGTVAGLPEPTLATLAEAGEHMGIAFQLRDDELGLLSDETRTGKPSGSDIRGNKKTLIRLLMLRKASPKDRQTLLRLFGNPRLTAAQFRTVRRLYSTTGAAAEIQIRTTFHAMKAEHLIETGRLPQRLKRFLHWLRTYAVERSR